MKVFVHRQSRVFSITFIISTFLLLFLLAGVVLYIDPLFHYHKPLNEVYYSYNSGQRYVNDGITRNCEYEAIITGTSHVENFKPSEFLEYFGVNAIKVPFSGASFYETGMNLKRGYSSGHDIKYVVWSLDSGRLGWKSDYLDPSFDYPTYLTNNEQLDDVNYLFNKDILFRDTISSILGTISGLKSAQQDYLWSNNGPYGRAYVLKQYTREKECMQQREISEEELEAIRENIEMNIIPLVINHPETTFLFFFPPASVAGMDSYKRIGELNVLFDSQQYTYELLSKYDNVCVYTWADNLEFCSIDNYRDLWHYSPENCSRMLYWMSGGYGLLTLENYKQKFSFIKDLYINYDYDGLFE